jgi:small-conductance mechanosensitive channel
VSLPSILLRAGCPGLLLLLLSVTFLGRPTSAAEAPVVPTAPVVVDGVTLFHVRGVSAFPADERAALIAQAIRAAARDAAVKTSSLRIIPEEPFSILVMGDHRLMEVHDADAALEAISRQELAFAYARRIRAAIEAYRRGRSWRSLLLNTGASLAATAVLAGAVLLFSWLWRRLDVVLSRWYMRRSRAVEIQAVPIVHAERIRAVAEAGLRAMRTLVLLGLAYFYLSFVLTRFPGTRPTAARLFAYVRAPFLLMGRAALDFIPNLIFLIVLILVTRYILKLLSLVAAGVERGTISLKGFAPEWTAPTSRLIRIAVIGFSVVVAYPYIPGSESAAFKGVSIFFGVVFSLGASPVVANMLAGYSLIYRRTFKLGDRVKINDVVGDVVVMRLQVTHLRTVKNEDVIIPNSTILTSQVVNYSTYVADDGLILHTTVGIGYEVPWRKVEAMLLEAAGRTPGLRTAPPPFVLQTLLGDFSVNYELNVYCDDAHAMAARYSALHRNIQDVFNEYGVQIMTPAYVADPTSPKVVPRSQWYQPPAPNGEDVPSGGIAGQSSTS